MEIRLSAIWKERILDLLRFAGALLAFWSIWLVRSGDPVKYDIPAIITGFQIVTILIIITLGEYQRSSEKRTNDLEKKIAEFEAERDRIKKS